MKYFIDALIFKNLIKIIELQLLFSNFLWSKSLIVMTYQASVIAMVVNTAIIGIGIEGTFIACATWWLCGWSSCSLCSTLCGGGICALCRCIWIMCCGRCWRLCWWDISIVPVVLCSSHQWIFSLSTEFTLNRNYYFLSVFIFDLTLKSSMSVAHHMIPPRP